MLHQAPSSQHPTVAPEPPLISSRKRSPDGQIGFVLRDPNCRARLPTPDLPCLASRKSEDCTLRPAPLLMPFCLSLFPPQSNAGVLFLSPAPTHSTSVPGPYILCLPITRLTPPHPHPSQRGAD